MQSLKFGGDVFSVEVPGGHYCFPLGQIVKGIRIEPGGPEKRPAPLVLM
jgi:hypothetical protein